MKRTILQLFTLVTVAVACNSAPKADKAKTEDGKDVVAAEGTPYRVDSLQYINFIGTKPVGEHHGTFNIKEGVLYVQNEAVVKGGKLVFDINSLKISDTDTTGVSKLKAHLSSADFLDTEQYPTATFEITSIENYTPDSTNQLILNDATNTVKGNLTLKGVTKNISFPALIKVTPAIVTVKANFNIDRTEWKLVYGNDQSLGDKFIRPEVNINFDITAIK